MYTKHAKEERECLLSVVEDEDDAAALRKTRSTKQRQQRWQIAATLVTLGCVAIAKSNGNHENKNDLVSNHRRLGLSAAGQAMILDEERKGLLREEESALLEKYDMRIPSESDIEESKMTSSTGSSSQGRERETAGLGMIPRRSWQQKSKEQQRSSETKEFLAELGEVEKPSSKLLEAATVLLREKHGERKVLSGKEKQEAEEMTATTIALVRAEKQAEKKKRLEREQKEQQLQQQRRTKSAATVTTSSSSAFLGEDKKKENDDDDKIKPTSEDSLLLVAQNFLKSEEELKKPLLTKAPITTETKVEIHEEETGKDDDEEVVSTSEENTKIDDKPSPKAVEFAKLLLQSDANKGAVDSSSQAVGDATPEILAAARQMLIKAGVKLDDNAQVDNKAASGTTSTTMTTSTPNLKDLTGLLLQDNKQKKIQIPKRAWVSKLGEDVEKLNDNNNENEKDSSSLKPAAAQQQNSKQQQQAQQKPEQQQQQQKPEQQQQQQKPEQQQQQQQKQQQQKQQLEKQPAEEKHSEDEIDMPKTVDVVEVAARAILEEAHEEENKAQEQQRQQQEEEQKKKQQQEEEEQKKQEDEEQQRKQQEEEEQQKQQLKQREEEQKKQEQQQQQQANVGEQESEIPKILDDNVKLIDGDGREYLQPLAHEAWNNGKTLFVYPQSDAQKQKPIPEPQNIHAFVITLDKRLDVQEVQDMDKSMWEKTSERLREIPLIHAEKSPGVDPKQWPQGSLQEAEYAIGFAKLFWSIHQNDQLYADLPPESKSVVGKPWIGEVEKRDQNGYFRVSEQGLSHHYGCLYAHMYQWQKIKDQGLKKALILESDGLGLTRVPLESIPGIASQLPGDADFVTLQLYPYEPAGVERRNVEVKVNQTTGEHKTYSFDKLNYHPKQGYAGLASYIATNTFVEKIQHFLALHGADMIDGYILNQLCTRSYNDDQAKDLAWTMYDMGEFTHAFDPQNPTPTILNCYKALADAEYYKERSIRMESEAQIGKASGVY
jgi:hypothetical protein